MSAAIRLRRSWWHLRKAIRILYQPAPRVPFGTPSTADWHTPPTSDHPSSKCTCGIPPHAGAYVDHFQGCPWLAAMCKACSGTGWCSLCGGDGVAPDDESAPRTAREVKEWCLGVLQELADEFGFEHACRNFEEAILGQAVDPDGRPLHVARTEPLAGDLLMPIDPAAEQQFIEERGRPPRGRWPK